MKALIPFALIALLVATSAPSLAQWWGEGAPLVSFPEPAVGACYPWLVMRHSLMDLATGVVYPGVGGDSAVSASCGDRFIAVIGASGVYFFSKDTGMMVAGFPLSNATRVLGANGDAVAVYDQLAGVVFVKMPYSSDVAVRLAFQPDKAHFALVSGSPVVVYSVNGSYRVASLSGDVALPYRGSGAVFGSDDKLFVESSGILVLDASSYATVDYVPLPFAVTEMLSYRGGSLLARAGGVLVRVDVASKKYYVLGAGEPTPVGVYVPDTGTTYVESSSGVYPVPGYATVDLGLAAITTVDNATSVLWPYRASILYANDAVEGVMYLGGYGIRVSLQPGVYRVPAGATIVTPDGRRFAVEGGEVYYPEAPKPVAPVPASSVITVAGQFPANYAPLDVITGVRAVFVGGDKAVLLKDDRAVIYGEKGPLASVPGRWDYGGVGECVVLYDGSTFRVYDVAGNNIANYAYPLQYAQFTTCRLEDGKPVVYAVSGTTLYRITENGTRITAPTPFGSWDPTTGLTALANWTISAPGFAYPLQYDASGVAVNGLSATWRRNDALYFLRLGVVPTLTVLLGAPTNASFYPLKNYVLMFDASGTVSVLPVASWLRGCYVNVLAPPDATVSVDGRTVGNGTVTVYVDCGANVTVRAEKPYHRPAEASVTVDGPVTLLLNPEPILASVKLEVIAPEGLDVEKLVLQLDDQTVEWAPGEVKQLLAKTYAVTLVSASPVSAFERVSFNATFTEGNNTLTVPCRLITSIIVVKSSVPASVRIYRPGETSIPMAMAYVTEQRPAYFPVTAGQYVVVATSGESNRVPFNATVSVGDREVVVVNATPPALGKIRVVPSVPSATVIVTSPDGSTVANGTGIAEASVPPGNYTVSASAPGYLPYTVQVEVKPGETAEVIAPLTPVATPPPPENPPICETPTFQLGAVATAVAVAVAVLLLRRRKSKPIEAEGAEL